MLLSELIEQLKEIHNKHGDIECFTNGEYGIEDTTKLSIDTVSAGLAENELEDHFLENNEKYAGTIVLHIGGY